MKETKTVQIPIDWNDISDKTGMRSGKLCKSLLFGWGVQNDGRNPGPHFAEYKPPFDIGQEYEGGTVRFVKIDKAGRNWELEVEYLQMKGE